MRPAPTTAAALALAVAFAFTASLPCCLALPKGLFVSSLAYVDSVSESGVYRRAVDRALDLACGPLNASSGAHHVHSVAFDHLTASNGSYVGDALAGVLDRVAAKGGGCNLDAIYVGLADNHYPTDPVTGAWPDIYCSRLANRTWVQGWVDRSLVAAKRFARANQQLDFQWYIPYEGVGNDYQTGCSSADGKSKVGAAPARPAPPLLATGCCLCHRHAHIYVRA